MMNKISLHVFIARGMDASRILVNEDFCAVSISYIFVLFVFNLLQ